MRTGKKYMSLIEEIREIKIPAWTQRWKIATPYWWWIAFSTVLGFFMLRLVLMVVYTILIVPTGLFMRIFGKDPMGIKPRASYWITHHE